MSKPTLVIKIGGTAGLDYHMINQDIASLWVGGAQMVIVHGGSEEATKLGHDLGYPPRFVTSPSGFTSRFTDIDTLRIFTMAVNGQFNTTLVAELSALGVQAFGLCGVDGGLIRAQRKAAIRIVENGKTKMLRGDFTGKIKSIDATLIKLLLDAGLLPVVAPLALSEEHETVTTDADRAAAMIAGALEAPMLVFLTAAPGLLRNYPDETSLVGSLRPTELDRALAWAEGRMKKKVLAAGEAFENGVKQVIIADGRAQQPVTAALGGAGTQIQ